MFRRTSASRGLGIKENDSVHSRGVTHPEPGQEMMLIVMNNNQSIIISDDDNDE